MVTITVRPGKHSSAAVSTHHERFVKRNRIPESASRRNVSMTDFAMNESSPVVGSSAKRMPGSRASSEATFNRFRSPPDSPPLNSTPTQALWVNKLIPALLTRANFRMSSFCAIDSTRFHTYFYPSPPGEPIIVFRHLAKLISLKRIVARSCRACLRVEAGSLSSS